jgi:hypothetical protein
VHEAVQIHHQKCVISECKISSWRHYQAMNLLRMNQAVDGAATTKYSSIRTKNQQGHGADRSVVLSNN